MGGGLLLHTLLNNRVPKLVSKKVKKIHTMKINIKNPVYFCILHTVNILVQKVLLNVVSLLSSEF